MSYRNRDLLDCSYSFPCLLRFPGCEGGSAGEPAHSNQAKHGKGGAMKAHDCFTVPACRSCHLELDQGKTMTRDEKREAWDHAFWAYLPMLWESGLLSVNKRLLERAA